MTDQLKHHIRKEAIRLGFSHCGVAPYATLEDIRPFYSGFIKNGGHASFNYLKTNLEKRIRPELLLEGTRSVIALLVNYFPREIIPENDNFIISKYAYGKDYKKVIGKMLNDLITATGLDRGEHRSRAFVDSGPVLEKAWAQRCGVGWQGKNTLIINRSGGSYFFIGIILTTQDLEPDAPERDHCGSCRLCIEACPTGALDTPYQLDIHQCIAYLTIESRQPIPPEFSGKMRDRIYGCDICQDVCPYNRFARPNVIPEFNPSEKLFRLRKKDWRALTEQEFEEIFQGMPVQRSGYQNLKKNMDIDDLSP
jgi:epoxyqueuosine reductase